MKLTLNRATLAIPIVTALLLLLCVDTVPPRSMTTGNMHVMKRQILRYAATQGTLPTSPKQLPRIDGFHNDENDGWGRPILMTVKGDEVTLVSYGRDGLPGGTGEDADVVGVFRARTEDGRWADEFCAWRIDPYFSR